MHESISTIGSCCHLLFLPPTTFAHLHFPSFHIWHKSQERLYRLGPPQVIRIPIPSVPCLAALLLFRFVLILSPPSIFLAKSTEFVTGAIEPAEAAATDILVALVCIQCTRPYLTVQTEGWAIHCVLFNTLIIASKYFKVSTNVTTIIASAIHHCFASEVHGLSNHVTAVIEVSPTELTVKQCLDASCLS